MTDFVGRASELAMLRKRLARVADSGSGIALAIRGRRQIGKSRLVQEFCDASGVPYVYYTATKGFSPGQAVAAFMTELRDSALPDDRELVPDTAVGGWLDAWRTLATTLPDSPAIVVIDELPWLAEQDETFDGSLQTGWDRLLSRRPVLLLLLGSDIHMMERPTAYDRPFYGRAENFVLGPLNVTETGRALRLDSPDTIDAHLISGGLPGIMRTWPHGMSPLRFVEQECADPAAALFGVPEATLLAEFPLPDQARRVLEAIGGGDRTYANVAATAGGRQGPITSGSLTPLLHRLTHEKQVLAVDQPLSTRPGKPALYRVADSNLRLYMAILRSVHELVLRGRPEAAYRLFLRRWETWRGKAVEPLVRASLELAGVSGALPWPDVEAVGGWWNRQFDPEIDLVGADRSSAAERLYFTGSIKWLSAPFDRRDLVELTRSSADVPGVTADTGLVIVSRSGTSGIERAAVDLVWGPTDLVSAWEAT